MQEFLLKLRVHLRASDLNFTSCQLSPWSFVSTAIGSFISCRDKPYLFHDAGIYCQRSDWDYGCDDQRTLSEFYLLFICLRVFTNVSVYGARMFGADFPASLAVTA